MPQNIQLTLGRLFTEILFNLEEVLKNVLETSMLELAERYKLDKNFHININGTYNTFNQLKTSHKEYILKLKMDIRDHLKIDESW